MYIFLELKLVDNFIVIEKRSIGVFAYVLWDEDKMKYLRTLDFVSLERDWSLYLCSSNSWLAL